MANKMVQIAQNWIERLNIYKYSKKDFWVWQSVYFFQCNRLFNSSETFLFASKKFRTYNKKNMLVTIERVGLAYRYLGQTRKTH